MGACAKHVHGNQDHSLFGQVDAGVVGAGKSTIGSAKYFGLLLALSAKYLSMALNTCNGETLNCMWHAVVDCFRPHMYEDLMLQSNQTSSLMWP